MQHPLSCALSMAPSTNLARFYKCYCFLVAPASQAILIVVLDLSGSTDTKRKQSDPLTASVIAAGCNMWDQHCPRGATLVFSRQVEKSVPAAENARARRAALD